MPRRKPIIAVRSVVEMYEINLKYIWAKRRYQDIDMRRLPAPAMSREARPLYKTLDCWPASPDCQIQESYYRLAREHHPDLEGDAERFNEVAQAFEVLSDPEKRRLYDATGAIPGTSDGRRDELAMKFCMGLLVSYFAEKNGFSAVNLDFVDLVGIIRQSAAKFESNIRKHIAFMEKESVAVKELIQKCRERWTGADTIREYLIIRLEDQLRQSGEEQLKAQKELQTVQHARKMMEEANYKMDVADGWSEIQKACITAYSERDKKWRDVLRRQKL